MSTNSDITDSSFADFLDAALVENGQLGIGNWIQLINVANRARMKVEAARRCLERLVAEGLSRQTDDDKFLIDVDRVRSALTRIVQGVESGAPTHSKVVADDGMAMLRALFIASESSGPPPTVKAFRVQNKDRRRIIDDLVERGFIKTSGSYYRLTLDGLYAVDLDAVRNYIAMFNDALPALQSLYGRSDDGQIAVKDVLNFVDRSHPVVERELVRALSYVLPDLGPGILLSASMDSTGDLVSFRVGEAILDTVPLPMTRDLSPSRTRSESQQREPPETDGEDMPKNPRDVFVVHGRDQEARDAIFNFLRAVGLNPMEWEESRHLTGKTSPYIGEVLDAAFAAAQAIVVLLTGDDEARLRADLRGSSEPPHEMNLTPQARSNVLFEAGMALGRHPDRTVLVELGDLRPFSDIAGRHTVRLQNGGARERQTIVQRLKDAGCDVVTDARSDWLDSPFFRAVLGESRGTRKSPAPVSSSPGPEPGEALLDAKPKRKAITRLDQVGHAGKRRRSRR